MMVTIQGFSLTSSFIRRVPMSPLPVCGADRRIPTMSVTGVCVLNDCRVVCCMAPGTGLRLVALYRSILVPIEALVQCVLPSLLCCRLW